jgi:hypothetical protein
MLMSEYDDICNEIAGEIFIWRFLCGGPPFSFDPEVVTNNLLQVPMTDFDQLTIPVHIDILDAMDEEDGIVYESDDPELKRIWAGLPWALFKTFLPIHNPNEQWETYINRCGNYFALADYSDVIRLQDWISVMGAMPGYKSEIKLLGIFILGAELFTCQSRIVNE